MNILGELRQSWREADSDTRKIYVLSFVAGALTSAFRIAAMAFVVYTMRQAWGDRVALTCIAVFVASWLFLDVLKDVLKEGRR